MRWMQAIQHWESDSEKTDSIPYTLVPIRIPKDTYRLNIVPVPSGSGFV